MIVVWLLLRLLLKMVARLLWLVLRLLHVFPHPLCPSAAAAPPAAAAAVVALVVLAVAAAKAWQLWFRSPVFGQRSALRQRTYRERRNFRQQDDIYMDLFMV